MSSSRLPGKVLQDLAGEPMLVRVVERARRARSLDMVAVATTDDPSDDPIQALCESRGYPFYRGSLYDVLDRYYQAARHFQADVVVRLTADCPMIDPDEIDRVVGVFQESGADFAANRLPPPWKRTVPIGLDTEVCSFAALERAWREAQEKYEREHVMPYLYDQPGRFKVQVADMVPDYGTMRWTVDTPSDLDLVRQVYAALGKGDRFTTQDVLDLYRRQPELAQVNAEVKHKSLTDIDDRNQPPGSGSAG